jgi:hypothetical protein
MLDHAPEYGVLRVQLFAHLEVLRALSREHENQRSFHEGAPQLGTAFNRE